MNQFAAIPCITVICYLFAEIFKAITKGKRNNLVPIICGAVGAVAGLIGFFCRAGFSAGRKPFLCNSNRHSKRIFRNRRKSGI